MGAVELDFEVQAVVHEQDGFRCSRLTGVARELRGVSERGGGAVRELDGELARVHHIPRGVLVATGGERRGLIQKLPGKRDDLGAALGIVAAGLAAAIRFRNHVRAIKRVVEAAPAGIGGVERVAGVGDRHYELRPGNQRDLGVHIGGGGGEIRAFRQEIADLAEEFLVGRRVVGRAGVAVVPAVDLRLQGVALGEQRADARGEVGDDFFQRGPDGFRGETRAGADALAEKIVEDGGDLEAALGGAMRHGLKWFR